ncbi:SPOR domain-containing protein [Cytophagales bacterium LB-30]|uniref:SPOR domain-containing protein n=1 Tax=Shiella aurantiaca TaxID=3058365 RepID=A0ABT8F5H1_9BACT|nr:SPOR domain-containing protein [Shiella aurantiaca]MDN4165732.1 SPOR domain-containing protein [Shiella aurantiaca]
MIRFTRLFFGMGLLAVFAYSCKPAAPASSGSTDARYSEDLSAYRPQVELEKVEETEEESSKPEQKSYPRPSADNTLQLNAALDSIAENTRKVRYIDGYTVLVYTGTDRDKAMQAKAQATHLVAKHRPDVQYVPPTYKVKVGRFVDRLEAQKVYATLKVEFSKAIIIPEKVYLK